MDQDRKRTIDKAMLEYAQHLDEVKKRTQRETGDGYYEIWDFNASFANLMLSVKLGGNWDRESLLGRGFYLMMSEAYLLHELVAQGNYYPSLRELRFLLEFAKRASVLDLEMDGRTAADKLVEYEVREYDNRPDFRGGGLQLKLKSALGLTADESEAIRDLFDSLSSHAHGSASEISVIGHGRSTMRDYSRELFDEAYKNTAAVADIYFLLLVKRGMITSADVRIPATLSGLFPLSYQYLKVSGD